MQSTQEEIEKEAATHSRQHEAAQGLGFREVSQYVVIYHIMGVFNMRGVGGFIWGGDCGGFGRRRIREGLPYQDLGLEALDILRPVGGFSRNGF